MTWSWGWNPPTTGQKQTKNKCMMHCYVVSYVFSWQSEKAKKKKRTNSPQKTSNRKKVEETLVRTTGGIPSPGWERLRLHEQSTIYPRHQGHINHSESVTECKGDTKNVNSFSSVQLLGLKTCKVQPSPDCNVSCGMSGWSTGLSDWLV